MSSERVAGLIITIGYTVLVLVAITGDATPGTVDAVPWIAAGVALAIQVLALTTVGWWGTIVLRVAAEFMSAYRIWLARQHLGMSFRLDDDEHGQHYIHCYRCGDDSYSAMDIEQLYCGNCHKFHQGQDGAMT
jgi:ribosomal protein S27AE